MSGLFLLDIQGLLVYSSDLMGLELGLLGPRSSCSNDSGSVKLEQRLWEQV